MTMYGPDVMAPLMVHMEYRAHKVLMLYVPPILLISGTTGNIFSFVVLSRKPMRKFSTYLYLSVLSLADTLVLYIGLLRLWIGEITGNDFRNHSDWVCKIIMVLGYTVSDYSVWLIIAVTIERYIVVADPFKIQQMCNISRAVKIILSLLLVLLAINAHFLWTVKIQYHTIGDQVIPQCEGADNYTYLVETAWPWVDACLYSFAPFVVILIFNIMIVANVVRARTLRMRLQEETQAVQQDNTRLTIMLLTISFTFVVTTLPMNLTAIVQIFWKIDGNDLKGISQYVLLKTVTTLLMYLNHSMNFIIYCITGRKFRQQLMWMTCRRIHAFAQVLQEPSHSGNTMQMTQVRTRVKSARTNGPSEASCLVNEDHEPEKQLHVSRVKNHSGAPAKTRKSFHRYFRIIKYASS